MTAVMTTTVFVRDVTNRRVHKRYRHDGDRALYTTEVETPDSSGAYVVLTDAEMAEVEPDALCPRCFPKDGDA